MFTSFLSLEAATRTKMPATTSSRSSWNWIWRRAWKKSTATWPVPQPQGTSRLCSTLRQTSSSKKTLKVAVSSKQLKGEKRCAVTTSQPCQGRSWYRIIGSRWGRPQRIWFNSRTYQAIMCCLATTSDHDVNQLEPQNSATMQANARANDLRGLPHVWD